MSGLDELAEAARLELARIYSSTTREFQQPTDEQRIVAALARNKYSDELAAKRALRVRNRNGREHQRRQA